VPRFFATAAKGTEVALRDELRALRFPKVRADRGGVHFEGELRDGYRACLELRTAVRVLGELDRFEVANEQALYDGVRAIDWSRWLEPRRTLAVRASCRSSRLTHTQFIAQKTKDAIVDQQRDTLGDRSSVDREDPDLCVSVHLVENEATLYLDFSGRPLHLRGYRRDIGEAPLKETLAASLLMLAGWDRRTRFIDPMCGSGTIAIEAALAAADRAPGLTGGAFGFERWPSFDAAERTFWGALRERAAARAERAEAVEVQARDTSAAALDAARANAARAGVSVRVERASVATLASSDPVWVVTNPPYGDRMSVPVEVLGAMGKAFARLRGSTVGVIAGTPALLEAIPLRPDKRLPVMNGDIECRFAVYHP
jgi:putative N6-adenine-specific DNA methylase